MAQDLIFLIKTLPGTAAAASQGAEGICASRNPSWASFHFIATLGHAVLKRSNLPICDFYFFFPLCCRTSKENLALVINSPLQESLLQGGLSCCASQMTPRASGKCFLILKSPRSDFIFFFNPYFHLVAAFFPLCCPITPNLSKITHPINDFTLQVEGPATHPRE